MTQPTKIQKGDLVQVNKSHGVLFKEPGTAAWLPYGQFRPYSNLPMLVLETKIECDVTTDVKVKVIRVLDIKVNEYWWIKAENLLIYAKGR